MIFVIVIVTSWKTRLATWSNEIYDHIINPHCAYS